MGTYLKYCIEPWTLRISTTNSDVSCSVADLSEPHDCKKCCLSFSSLEEHQQHIQEFHPKEFHKCSTCNKVFPNTVLLDKHQSTHTGSKPFSCQFCNKSYQVGWNSSTTAAENTKVPDSTCAPPCYLTKSSFAGPSSQSWIQSHTFLTKKNNCGASFLKLWNSKLICITAPLLLHTVCRSDISSRGAVL